DGVRERHAVREKLRHLGNGKALSTQRAADVDDDRVDEFHIARASGERRVFDLRLGGEGRPREGPCRLRFVHAARKPLTLPSGWEQLKAPRASTMVAKVRRACVRR